MDGERRRFEPFADEIRRRRDAVGWTQEELADRAGVSKDAVASWETRRATPQRANLLALAKAFGLSQAETPTEFEEFEALWRHQRTGTLLRADADTALQSVPEESQPSTSTDRLPRCWVPMTVGVVLLAVALLSIAMRAAFEEEPETNPPPGPVLGAAPSTPGPVPLGGRWVAPEKEFVIEGQQVRLAARAYPASPDAPPVAFVNFTASWEGPEGGWRIACRAGKVKPGTPDTYECVWDLNENVPNGPVKVSFDVYDAEGNHRNSPNGMRWITVQR